MRTTPALFVLLVLLGCGGPPESPEAQVRRVLEALEAAVEEGDLSRLREHVSERYADALGHDRRALVALVTFHVTRSAQRRVFLRIHSIEVRGGGRAEVALAAGLADAGLRIPGGLAHARADVYWIDLDLEAENDGVWRVVWAQWRRTSVADLL